MRPTRAPAFCVVLLARTCLAAEPSPPQSLDVVISQHSVRINGVELRSGPPAGIRRYISLESAEKVLGPPQDTYLAGLGGARLRLARCAHTCAKGISRL